MRPLTARQREVLAQIQAHLDQTGFPPTRAEIASALGFRSVNAAEDHLKALARKGMIELCAGTSRGIRLLPAAEGSLEGAIHPAASGTAGHATARGANGTTLTRGGRSVTVRGLGAGAMERAAAAGLLGSSPSISLPLVGRVAAGHPILAESHIEASFTLDASLFERHPDYMLRIRGDSMRDAGMLDGDLLAVKATSDAHNGQIVVARLGQEVTVKRLHRKGLNGPVELLPENPAYEPIVVPVGTRDFHIEGIGVGLIRQRPPR